MIEKKKRSFYFFFFQGIFILCVFNNALGLLGDTEGLLGVDGSLRITGALSRNYDDPPIFERNSDQYLQPVLRITAAGRPARRLSYEAHLVSVLTYSTADSLGVGAGIGAQGIKSRYRAFDKTWDFIDEKEDIFGNLRLDRFNLKLTLGDADITIGRQAITFGKAYFWNPLDLYLPFDPVQFDRDYKSGVDALRLDISCGSFSGLNLIYVPGRELDINNQYLESRTWDASWFGSSLLLRGFTSAGGCDMAIQGGKVYGGWHFGGGLVGEIKTIHVRFEAARFWDDGGPLLSRPGRIPLLEDHLSAVIGLGRNWPNSLDIEVECLYNGGGESNNITIGLERVERGVILQAGRLVAGFTISYEFTPLILGRLTALHSLNDGSTQVQPTLTCSTGDNSELIMGASLNRGDRPSLDPARGAIIQSEFGAYPHYLFAEIKIYF